MASIKISIMDTVDAKTYVVIGDNRHMRGIESIKHRGKKCVEVWSLPLDGLKIVTSSDGKTVCGIFFSGSEVNVFSPTIIRGSQKVWASPGK